MIYTSFGPPPFSFNASSGAFRLAVFLMAPNLLLLSMETGAAGVRIVNVARIVELAYSGKHGSVTTHRKFSEMEFI